ncbi:MAG: cobalamin-dependent protein, partial [Nitrospinae bacterium]|nr:cobalamin-dependent protein [Nitrospinota bacterium]
MGYFKRVAIIKSQQKFEPIDPGYTTDITELCHLASFIEKDVDRVVIPVCPYDKNAFKNFRKSIKRENFDMVAISAMTPGYKSAREYARIAKEAGIYVVMGGYHPTALPEEVLADPNVDAVIRGEGELPFRDLVLNGPGPDVLGLSYQDNGDQVHNGPQSLIRDLDLLPMPNRKLRPVRFGEKGDAYSVDTVFSSRGCIAKCTFCANDTMNQNFRPRSPEHFVEELEQIHDSKVKKIVKFYDSIFLFDPARVEKIMELMFKRNLTNFRIYTESRSDDMIRCKHLMKDLKRLGFEKILIGIESPDEATFKKLRKGGSVGKHEKAIRILQEADIRMDAFLIIGHTHETEQDIKKYPEFAKRVGLHHQAVYFVMTPYPGTQIYKEY